MHEETKGKKRVRKRTCTVRRGQWPDKNLRKPHGWVRMSAQRSRYTTWNTNKFRELFAVKVLHTSLLNTTVVAFKVRPLGSYAPMSAPSPPFKTILEMVLWNGLQSCRCITPDVINVIKMPSFQYFLYLREQEKKSLGARSGE